ncbi:MAG: hypothetical protein FJ288_03440 [Planctomycetes bacterium]|nr:hypothetical protein [Planctomycetota bacterium]
MLRGHAVSAAAAAVVAAVVAAAFAGEAAKPTVLDFDADKAGEAPRGWEAAVGTWKVAADDTAPSRPNVLAQTAAGPNPQFNVALATGMSFKDLELTVKLKAVGGEKDQGGGPVWRAKDARNYYVCRWNPLENNFRLYKVLDGKRMQLATADCKAEAGWHAIRVTMKGETIECHLDGKKYLEAKDDALKDAGKAGLWTKADAATNFDDLAVAGK